MVTHHNSGQHFSTCSTVLALRLPETPATIGDHHLTVTLDLVKDAADCEEASICI